MSEFSVHRTADTIPALKYCLILDGERIAGGKPDYRGNNHLISWSTRETYGPVDQLNDENNRLRELAALWIVINKHMSLCATTDCGQCPVREECEESVYLEGLLGIDPKGLSWRVQKRMAELGVEADG